MKVLQTEEELKSHLKEQIQFLIRSSKSYDEGFEDEAKRLAVVIRVLVHDTSQSTSLLKLLKKKDILFYDTTVDLHQNTLLHQGGLAYMRISSNGAKYYAPLDDVPPYRANNKVPFDDWWNKTVYLDLNRNQFTRKSLVLAVSNTDGGAHVDPRLNKAYAGLSRFNSLGWKFFKNEVEKDFKNGPELPSIRQIAHEVLKSLADKFPEHF
ncbi:MAG: hypothetical protein KAU16_08685 [Methanophagales archaeon]|nr:hypothetical protein [Methanophagales archaeon]